jgi:hypothetical protein
MLPPPVELRPPELVLKAVSDGLRIGLQVLAVPGLKRPLAEQGAWWCGPRRMWVMRAGAGRQDHRVLRIPGHRAGAA